MLRVLGQVEGAALQLYCVLWYVWTPRRLAVSAPSYIWEAHITACNFGVAFAPNITVALVFRFLSGFFGSAFSSVSGGSVSDVFPNHKVGTYVSPQLAMMMGMRQRHVLAYASATCKGRADP